MKNVAFVLLGGLLCFLGGPVLSARAVEIPDNSEFLEHPERVTGQPLAYIRLVPDAKKAGETSLDDLRKENGALVGYREIALSAWDTDHPLLETQAFNLHLQKLVKVYINWDQVASIQILDPKISLPGQGGVHEKDH